MTDHLTDCVTEDDDRVPIEKETSITFSKCDDQATIFTAEGGMVRRLLRNPEFDCEYVERATGELVRNPSELQADGGRDCDGWRKHTCGCLKIKQTSRESAGHAQVVSR